MTAFSHALDRLSGLLYRLCSACSILLAAVMAALVFCQVVLRYLFTHSVPGMDECALICMMWVAFFGGSLLFAEQSGISVTVLVERLPATPYRWAKLVFHVLTIVFMALLLVYGYNFALVGKRMMFGAIQVPKFWSYLSIPVGAAFALIFEANHLMKTLLSDPDELHRQHVLAQTPGEGG